MERSALYECLFNCPHNGRCSICPTSERKTCSERGEKRIYNIKVYQYIFYDTDNDEMIPIQGANLYEVNTRAYKLYCDYFGSETYDDYGHPKQTLLEFCTWHEKHKGLYNGTRVNDCYFDIMRNDFDI